MYINKLFPFLGSGDFIRTVSERKTLDEIICPINFKKNGRNILGNSEDIQKKYVFKAYHVLPCDVYVLNEQESTLKKIVNGDFGSTIDLSVTEIDYLPIARRIEVSDNKAYVYINGAYMQEEIVTDIFVNSASNGTKTSIEMLGDIKIEPTNGVDLREWAKTEEIGQVKESADFLDDLIDDTRNGKRVEIDVNGGEDYVYKWLDSYFSLPEDTGMGDGGREVVPLLIGPTGVFKSATVKELCRKYDYRLVDFRVSFTSRLDYSGLFQMGEVDGQKYSYACPMEELVTCSDGFREYCRKAYDRVSQILTDGYIEENKSSNGESEDSTKSSLSEEQKETLKELLESYKEYMKTPVLFFDEITRTKDAGVNGILVQLLNQKKFNNMTLNGCKFVAATNMNLVTGDTRHDNMMDELDNMYDVNTDLDIAYSNRFMPLKVLPEDVAGRWYSWAEGTKKRKDKEVQNIHPIILKFLNSSNGKVRGQSLLYNETPVLDAIDEGLTENEQKSQTFPNYRTWEMLSDYMYSIDDEYERELKEDSNAVRMFRENIINGLISSWAGEKFIGFIIGEGYKRALDVKGEPDDDVGDFLESTLEAGVPALLIGPSSLGKTSRVNAYMKKVEKRTGLKPVLINVNLASLDTTDLMGMPTKVSLVDYVGGGKLESKGLGAVGKELGSIVKSISDSGEYGMVDTMTLRAPDKTVKDKFKKALDEGREVILFFDECNRVKNPTIMSAMFECISDYRFEGISFKSQKDRVKIIAACNMSHSQMGDDGWGMEDYGDAGSIDPALAARFSIYWKKKYDKKDVKSWILFMEDQVKEGNIDGTILEYFKTLSEDEAVRVMASVEKRKLQNAESSTRALFQLSKDIKSMRGKAGPNGFKKSLYNGKVIFDETTVNELRNLDSSIHDDTINEVDLANMASRFIEEICDQSNTWEPMLVGDKVNINGREMTAQDLVDTLNALNGKIKDMTIRPLTGEDRKTIKIYVNTASSILDACSRLDRRVSDNRQKIFEANVGEEFTLGFLPYFNNVFGSEDDVEITIEMLEDDKLIKPFIKKRRALNESKAMTSDMMVDDMIELMKEFWKVHSNRLPSKNYATLISEIGGVLPSSDSIAEMLSRSGTEVDGVYACAEGEGDAWIMSILKNYPSSFLQSDIEEMREKMSEYENTKKEDIKNRRTRIL